MDDFKLEVVAPQDAKLRPGQVEELMAVGGTKYPGA
jgi:hypothetical protein